MNTFNTPAEVITNVATPDIARWIARIHLVDFALQQPHFVDLGDSVGYMYQGLTQFAKEGGDWLNDPTLEDLAVYELKPSIGYDKVVNGPSRYADDPRYAEGKNISMDIQRTALRTGLGRIGLYQSEGPQVPTDALAALHYMRGNIRDQIDRRLYERSGEIDEAVTAIESMVKARTTTRRLQTYRDGEWQPVDQEVTVYEVVHRGVPERARDLGLDPESPVDPWWQELQQDLSRIDEVAVAATARETSSGNL